MRTWKKIVLGIVLLLALGIGFIVLILPRMVENRAELWFRQNTHRQLTVASLSINPLTLSAEVRGLALSEPDSRKEFLSARKISLSLSPVSLVRFALILGKLQIERPTLTVIREGRGRFNFSDLAKSRKSGKAGASPTRFIINNLTITDGTVDYIDRSVAGKPHHRIRHLDLSLPFVGNEPYIADQYVTPSLSAVFDQSPVVVKGQLKPFANAVEASVTLNLHDLELPRYLNYLPAKLPVAVKTGRLSASVKLSYRVSRTQKPTLQVAGQLTTTGLSIRDKAGEPILFLPLVQLEIEPSRPLDSELRLGSLLVYNPELFVTRDREGRWNFPRMAGKKSSSSGKAFHLALQSIRLRGGKIHFRDARPPGGFTTEAKDIAFDLGRYSSTGSKPVPLDLHFRTERGERGDFKGRLTPSPLAVTGSVRLAGIPLAAYYPYLAKSLTAPVGGTAGASAELAFGTQGLKIQGGKVEISDLSAPFAPGEGFHLERFALAGLSLDLAQRKLEVASLDFEKGDLRFSRDVSGTWSPLSLLRRPAERSKAAGAPKPVAKPIAWRIDQVRGTAWKIAFRDKVPKAKPSFGLSGIDFSLDNLASPQPVPATFQLKGLYGRKGKVDLSGSLVQASGRIRVRTRLGRIPLADFSAYIPPNIRIILAGGTLDADLVFSGRTRGTFQGNFSGRLGLRNFYCLDAQTRQDLLRWGNFQASGISGALKPFSLRIKSVALDDYYARVVVDKRARLNLLQVFASEGKKKKEKAPSPQASPHRRNIEIDAITLQGGTVDFLDHHLVLPFETRMLKLGGRVSGLGSGAGGVADVDLRGSLRNQSPLSITGKINPIGKDFYARLKMTFSNIELTPFTPYTGTFLGYAIEKGKLFLSLSYLIDHKKLDAQNKVFLDQFTLGDSVKSKRATSLPVRLAIALLKDRNGEIHLDIPVTGRTDDPHFSVISVVWTVLKNLLVKAATSPLALLSSIFGGKEDFSSVNFPYGSAVLGPPEKQKLTHLAKALLDRPGLKLEIEGFVDPEHDPEAYREAQLQQRVRRAKFLDLVKKKKLPEGESAKSVTVAPGEYSKYLTEVYRKADFPKPHYFFGMLKSLPDKEMKKLLLANIPAGAVQMKGLAQARTAAVQSFLAGKKVPQERMFVVATDIYKAPKKAGTDRSRVEFGLGTR